MCIRDSGDYTDITKQYTDDDPMPYEVNILRSEILSIDMNEIFVERDPSFNLITGSFKVRDNGYTFKSLDESVAIVSNDGVVTPADQTSAIALGTTYIVVKGNETGATGIIKKMCIRDRINVTGTPVGETYTTVPESISIFPTQNVAVDLNTIKVITSISRFNVYTLSLIYI